MSLDDYSVIQLIDELKKISIIDTNIETKISRMFNIKLFFNK